MFVLYSRYDEWPKNACPYMAATGPNASNNATYTIASTDASGFVWTVPAQASIINGQGTNTITVHYASTFVSGLVGVTVSSTCGDPEIRVLSITKATPLAPAAVFGPLNACSYIGTATQINYYINPVANAITYRWTLPPNVTLVSATPDSTSIMVTFENGYELNILKSVKVKSISGCANSADKSITVATTKPATPGTITGPFNALTNKYDVAPVNACVFIGSTA